MIFEGVIKKQAMYGRCGCCELSTGGLHSLVCPLYEPTQIYESYAEYVVRRKREIEEHPEWGIKIL